MRYSCPANSKRLSIPRILEGSSTTCAAVSIHREAISVPAPPSACAAPRRPRLSSVRPRPWCRTASACGSAERCFASRATPSTATTASSTSEPRPPWPPNPRVGWHPRRATARDLRCLHRLWTGKQTRPSPARERQPGTATAAATGPRPLPHTCFEAGTTSRPASPPSARQAACPETWAGNGPVPVVRGELGRWPAFGEPEATPSCPTGQSLLVPSCGMFCQWLLFVL